MRPISLGVMDSVTRSVEDRGNGAEQLVPGRRVRSVGMRMPGGLVFCLGVASTEILALRRSGALLQQGDTVVSSASA